ncbi:MAG: SAM-dependent methyltransferase [Ruminococcus sp.]|nr:SAM-dependent methyltransferase [Ruminococcus sp.]
MKDECLICGAPLVYKDTDTVAQCVLCHKEENTKTMCEQGHFICNTCHTKGIDTIIGVCLSQTSKNPVEILRSLMSLEFCHMHGPEHHIMVGASLLTAFKNAGGEIDLTKSLSEMCSRGKNVPGGACGFWGACGAGVSTGMFMSIVTGSTPLADRVWGLSNMMTSSALRAIGEVGGPRCCKRNSYLAVTEAVSFVKTHLGVEMELPKIKCTHFEENNQCIGERCPFR